MYRLQNYEDVKYIRAITKRYEDIWQDVNKDFGMLEMSIKDVLDSLEDFEIDLMDKDINLIDQCNDYIDLTTYENFNEYQVFNIYSGLQKDLKYYKSLNENYDFKDLEQAFDNLIDTIIKYY